MKKIVMLLSFSLVLFGYTQSINARTICYDVEGEVNTNNISSTQQFGTLDFLLTNQETGEEVRLEGNLNGMIVGSDAEGAIYLSHTATSNAEATHPFSFVTFNDRAVFTGVPAPDGCSIPVSETITEIIDGTGFTKKVKFVDIVVNGVLGLCEGIPNTFTDISGELCLKPTRYHSARH